jgi:hypothetical protein
MPNLDWNVMLDRQAAGKKFITYLINNPLERDAAIASPSYAREVFQTQGGMKLPPDVEIMTVLNRRPERDHLNIILIPENDPNPDPLTYWIAAWVPYSDQDNPAVINARIIDDPTTGIRAARAE